MTSMGYSKSDMKGQNLASVTEKAADRNVSFLSLALPSWVLCLGKRGKTETGEAEI